MTRTTLASPPVVQSCSISSVQITADARAPRSRAPGRRARLLAATLFLGLGLGGFAAPSTLVLAVECTLRDQVTGSVPNQFFGGSVAAIGDVNGDGVTDFAVGAPLKGPGTGHVLAEIDVFSGVDGALIYRQPGPVQSGFGFAIAALGDVNGDGVPDFIVGAPTEVSNGPVESPAGAVYVLSGRDGSTIHHKSGPLLSELGFSVAGGPDLDGDGVAEFVAGAPNADGGADRSGAAFLFSGSTGSAIQALRGEAQGDRFGESIEIFPERNLSPVQAPAEILVGAPGADVMDGTVTLLDAGAAYLFTPLSVTPARRFNGASADDHFGAAVAFIRGRSYLSPPGHFLLVGAPNGLTAPGTRAGLVEVFDPTGSDAGPVHFFKGALDGEAFGAAVKGIGDVTGDFVPDILVGAPGNRDSVPSIPGSVSVFGGENWLPLCQSGGFMPGERFGFSLSGFGDLDGDGFPEWLAGAPEFTIGPSAPLGQVRTFGVAAGPPPGHLQMIEVDNTPEKVLLRWTPVASTCTAMDYAVYGGRYTRIGQGLDGHLPEMCSTAGMTTVSVPLPVVFPPGTALFYIPVPEGPDEEGSYGQGSLGNEHPQSLRPCHLFLNTGTCP